MERYKILLVEDNILMRWWMMSSLEQAGFWVVASATVGEALRAAAVNPFDILITDWRLADGFQGDEILGEVRKTSPETIAVLISAEADEELTERAQAAGFDRVIVKPAPVMDVLGAVRDLLAKPKQEEKLEEKPEEVGVNS